jgi:dephospho-CoA kinase
MPSRKAICVTGMPGCGKEEFLKIASQAGLPVVRMGDVVREEASRRGISLTDEGVGGMAHQERQVHGPDIWARRTLERISDQNVVIDGVRSPAEVDTFRAAFGGRVTVVAVHASPRTRYKRISSRGRSDDVLTEEEMKVRDGRELKWGLGKVIALADYMIVNEGSLRDFKREAEEVLRKVLG